MKIGFLGLGVMGLPMAKNVVKKCGCPVLGYDVAEARLAEFKDFGGEVTSDPDDIYRTCDVVMQILPTHPIIIHSVERAIELGKPGNIIIDLSSTAPDIVLDLHKKTVAMVNAPAQAEFVDKLLPLLNEEELSYYRRGKNAHVHAVPKGATPAQYAKATGLEALFGALYLAGQTDRLNELFHRVMEDA